MQFSYRRYAAAQVLLGCFFFSSLALSVYADTSADAGSDSPLDAGITAVDNKDYAKAYEIFSKLAQAGNAEAQHNLAMLYRTGTGVEKNLEASLKWFQQAADQGVPDAQYYLGYMYDNGEAVEKNPEKAFEWYRKAAEHGQGLAQINLGVIYANGIGRPQNITEAYLWFHSAAAQGYKAALENRLIIEEALKEQGDAGIERLKHLKQQARGHFQQYVQPFGPKVTPRRSMPPPPEH